MMTLMESLHGIPYTWNLLRWVSHLMVMMLLKVINGDQQIVCYLVPFFFEIQHTFRTALYNCSYTQLV